MEKSSTYLTLQWIAEILSFKDNEANLITVFKTSEVNWDQVVTIASQHLMLPAVYCRLKAKNLLPHIPQDLNAYLEELTAINRNRNLELLKEVREISRLLDALHIDHVFIKGIALIAGNTYDDIGERMIGDVDILIPPQQIHEAFELLNRHGYTEEFAFSYKPKNYRHLSRQVNPLKLGAVELHSEVLVHEFKQLIDKDVLLHKIQKINGINIPSVEHSIQIAIFTTQINDKAHLFGFIKLKAIYDCLALGLPTNNTLLQNLSNQKFANSFLELSSLYFPDLKPYNTFTHSNLLRIYYTFKTNYPETGNLIQRIFYISNSLVERLVLIVGNKSYRRHILTNKLNFK